MTYLEAHMGLLASSDVLAWVWNSDNWDVVVMSSKELLGPWDDVSNHDGSAEREKNVLVIRVQD